MMVDSKRLDQRNSALRQEQHNLTRMMEAQLGRIKDKLPSILGAVAPAGANASLLELLQSRAAALASSSSSAGPAAAAPTSHAEAPVGSRAMTALSHGQQHPDTAVSTAACSLHNPPVQQQQQQQQPSPQQYQHSSFSVMHPMPPNLWAGPAPTQKQQQQQKEEEVPAQRRRQQRRPSTRGRPKAKQAKRARK